MRAFTEEQQRFIAHTAGPCLVNATAGSGKTTSLMAFIANLIRRGIEPERILCVTFTNAAADQMAPRLREMGVEQAGRVNFRTIHSLAYLILKEAGMLPDTIIEDNTEILKQVMQTADPDEVRNMATNISRYVGLGRPENFQPSGFLPWRFFEVFEAYSDYKWQNNQMDLDDLVEYASAILTDDEWLRRSWQERFDWVLVDEHQDTSRSQWGLLRLITPKFDPNLVCVGDDDQAIYSWRGSDPQIILNFTWEFFGAPVYPLTLNHRCPQAILEPAARLIAHNKGRYPKEIRAAKSGGNPPQVVEHPDQAAEVAWVVDLIRSAYERGERLEDYAVLYRTSIQSLGIIARLDELQIPYHVLGAMSDPFAMWAARDVLAYLKVAHGQGTVDDLERLLRRPRRNGLYKEFAQSLIRSARLHGRTAEDVLTSLARYGSAAVKITVAELREKLSQLASLKAAQTIPFILDELNYREGVESYCDWAGLEPSDVISRLNALTLMADPDAPSSVFIDLAALSAEKHRKKKEEGERRGVCLSTIHSAKGLEWPNVIIVGAVSVNHPLGADRPDCNVEEERRLFYVGMTRAMSRLWISYPRTWGPEILVQPSPFLVEAGLIS